MAIVAVSLVLFIAGAMLPALRFTGIAGSALGQSETYVGFLCLLLGSVQLLGGLAAASIGDAVLGAGWLANPFLAWALWSIWRGSRPRRITLLSAAGVALALLPLLAFQLPTYVIVCCETSYPTRLTAIGPGYIAWTLSALSALVGGLVIGSGRRARAAGSSA